MRKHDFQINNRYKVGNEHIYSTNNYLLLPAETLEKRNDGLGEWARTAEIGDTYVSPNFAVQCVPEGRARRICSHCGQPIDSEAFVVLDGQEIYCSEDCLHRHYDALSLDYIMKNCDIKGRFLGNPRMIPSRMSGIDRTNTYYTEYENEGYYD